MQRSIARANSIDDVVDVGVIAPGRAVAEHRDWLVLIDQSGEFGDGQIGSIARSKGREKAKAGDRQAMEVMECVRQELARFLGGGVRADRQVDRVGLSKRPFCAVAINTRARRVDEPRPGLEPAGGLEPDDGPYDVDVGV